MSEIRISPCGEKSSGALRDDLVLISGSDIRTHRGGETFLIQLSRDLTTQGLRHTILTKYIPRAMVNRSPSEVKAELGDIVRPYRVFEFFRDDSIPLDVSFLRVLTSNRSSTVYTLDTQPIFLLFTLVLTRLLGIRLTAAIHHPTQLNDLVSKKVPLPLRRILMFALNRVDQIHVLTRQSRDKLINLRIKSEVTVVPYYMHPRPFASRDALQGKFLVTFVGAFVEFDKGIDLLRDVMAVALGSCPNLTFIAVGTGPARDIFRSLEAKFPARVNIIGFLAGNDLVQIYERSHLVVVTSRVESFCRVALEATTYGNPIVYFSIDGISEAGSVYPEGSVPSFDTQQMAKRIVEHYENFERNRISYDALQRSCRTRAISKFGKEVIFPKLIKMLTS